MKKKATLFLLMSIASISMFSQITIGMDESPTDGALLQLKSESVSNGGANANKGLLLPRVEFDVTTSNTGNINNKLKRSLKITDSSVITASVHTGLMVYNVAPNTNVASGAPFADTKVCPGVYIWNGDKWERLMSTQCQ